VTVDVKDVCETPATYFVMLTNYSLCDITIDQLFNVWCYSSFSLKLRFKFDNYISARSL